MGFPKIIRKGGEGGGRVPHFTTTIPSLQPESPLHNPRAFPESPLCNRLRRLLNKPIADNVKAWNLQHHPLQQPCRLESIAGCNVGVLKPKCMRIYIYIHIHINPYCMYMVYKAGPWHRTHSPLSYMLLMWLMLYLRFYAIQVPMRLNFCFCVPSKTAGPQRQSRVPPIQTPRAPSSKAACHPSNIVSNTDT